MGTPRRWIVALVAGAMTLGTVLVGAAPASAAPVYQITASWADGTPTTVKSGDVVTGVWRVNMNDDAPAPANDPVDNVTVTITAQNGHFGSVPSGCAHRRRRGHQNPDCTTKHRVEDPAAPLADTGSNVVGWALGGLGLLLAGIALALIRRRRTA
jgi:LPXTG-motif cell wall-anchored protein